MTGTYEYERIKNDAWFDKERVFYISKFQNRKCYWVTRVEREGDIPDGITDEIDIDKYPVPDITDYEYITAIIKNTPPEGYVVAIDYENHNYCGGPQKWLQPKYDPHKIAKEIIRKAFLNGDVIKSAGCFDMQIIPREQKDHWEVKHKHLANINPRSDSPYKSKIPGVKTVDIYLGIDQYIDQDINDIIEELKDKGYTIIEDSVDDGVNYYTTNIHYIAGEVGKTVFK